MSVSTTANRISYVGDGVTTVFTFPYLFLANSDIVAYLDGVSTAVSVAGAGGSSGGPVTFGAAPAVGVAVELVRNNDLLQSTDLSANDPFPADSVERMSDKAMLAVQRAWDRAGRSLRLADGVSSSASMELSGDPAQYPGYYYGVGASGQLTFLLAPAGTAGALAGDLASTLDALKGGGLVGVDYGVPYTNLTVGFFIRRRVYADRWADPSGATDSTAGLALAKAELQSMGGGELILSAGEYKVLDCDLFSGTERIDVIGQGPGATRLVKNGGGAGTYALKSHGTVGTTSLLTLDATAGAHTVKVANAALWAIGDLALVRESTYVTGAAGRKQQILRLTDVNTGTGFVTFSQPLFEAFAMAASAELCVLGAVTDAGLYDLFIQGVNSNNSGGCVHLLYPTRFEIERVHAQYFSDDGAFTLQTAYDTHLHNVKAFDGINVASGGYGYGVSFDEACAFSSVQHSTFESCRECTFTNRTTHSEFSHNIVVGNYDNGFNTHGAQVTHCRAMDNDIIGTVSGSGMAVGFGAHTAGDSDILYKGNRIRSVNSSGIVVNAPSGKENNRVVVEGNVVYMPGIGAAASSGILVRYSNGVRLSDNVVDGVTNNVGQGVYVLNCSDFRSNDDTVRNVPNGYGFRYDTLTDAVFCGATALTVSSDNFRGAGTNVRTFINGRGMDDSSETLGAGATSNGRIQRGKYTMTFAAVSTKTETVTFPSAYPAGITPIVVATPEKDALGNWRCEVSAETNTGFDVTLVDVGGTNRTGSPKVKWMALE